MKNRSVLVLLLVVLACGCKPGDYSLGLNVLPGVTILDTRFDQEKATITTAIVTDSKIRVDRPKYNLLGSYNDPIFGRTDAGFATQFRLPYHPAYPATANLDSVVLSMSYKIIYGDTITPQTVNVYPLSGDLKFESQYLSSFSIPSLSSGELIGSKTFTPLFRTDSTQADTTQQYIRIRLSNTFGYSLLKIDSTKMLDNDIFLSYFKGLYINANPVPRRGTLMSLTPTSTSLTMYYHDATKDTLGYAYRVTSNSANVSSFAHDYSSARFFSNLDKGLNPDSLIYIQPTGGIKTKVNVPSLSTWKDSTHHIIDKAALVFHVDTIMSDFKRFTVPPRLYLKVINDDDTEEFPKDSELSSDYYGGYYSSASATYSFNVTQHLQKLIAGLHDGTMKNNGFYLVTADRSSSGKRVVLKSNHSAFPIELNVTYTRYR